VDRIGPDVDLGNIQVDIFCVMKSF